MKNNGNKQQIQNLSKHMKVWNFTTLENVDIIKNNERQIETFTLSN